MLHLTKSKMFRKYIIFITDRLSLQLDEMASRAKSSLQAVVWRPLV